MTQRRWPRVAVLAGALLLASVDVAPAEADTEGKCFTSRKLGDGTQLYAPQYPDAPVDPWLAVDGDRPERIRSANESWVGTAGLREEVRDCTAAHDHCLRDCTWFIEDLRRPAPPNARRAGVVHYDDTGMVIDQPRIFSHPGEHYVAYRTVPATRGNLKPGMLAVAHGPTKAPESEADAATPWRLGVVESVNWETGKLAFVDVPERYWLSAVRVPVLTYRPGGKVSVIEGQDPKRLAVAVSEVVLPPADLVRKNDPWAEVGPDGRPRDVDDAEPIDHSEESCGPERNHCLRPWVWLVESNDKLIPARFGKGGFYSALDPKRKIEQTGMAYRTAVVDRSKLTVGQRVVVYGFTKSPDSEYDAHSPQWLIGKIIEMEAGRVRLEGDEDRSPRYLSAVRVPVIEWFPGEKAEAVK